MDGKTPHIIRLPAGEWSKVSPADRLSYIQSDQYRLDTAEKEERQRIEREIAAQQIGQPTRPKKGRRKKRR
jgi:beta-lactamase class A